jgi:SAM-dependent methyltransferase
MGGWGDGYITTTGYSVNFQEFLSPTLLRTIPLLNGLDPAPLPENYTYCELGCGHASTLITLAATNPQGRFHGIDFMPDHVVSARALADAGSVTNVEIHEASFADLADGRGPSLPEFDFIVLHGVYTWISPDNRAAIRRFINARLKPGGIVYIGYNSLPGWLDGLVIQKVVKTLADQHSGPPQDRIAKALEEMKALAEAAPGYFKNSRTYDSILQFAERGQFAYLAHEFLPDHWDPMFFLDLAEDMAEARLSFAGTCFIPDNFANLAMTEEQRALIEPLAGRDLREFLRDYCDPGRFRRDVFVRGVRRLNAPQREDRLRPTRLALKVPPASVSFKVRVPVGEAAMNERAYRPVFDRLAEGPATVDDLLNLPEVRDGSALNASELVGMLVASGQVEVTPPEAALAPREGVARLNRVIAERAWYQDEGQRWALAAPSLANGWVSDTAERLLYLGLTSGIAAEALPLARFLAGPIRARGFRLSEDSDPDADEPAMVEHLTKSVGDFLQRQYPLWKQLGIL